MQALEGKTFVIVGGTTGMGRSAARACVAAGARVVLSGRPGEPLDDVRCEFAGRALCEAADAVDPSSAPRLIDLCVTHFGAFDGLYHIAGGSGRRMGDGPLHEVSDAGWEATLALNLTSAFNSARAACRTLVARGGGGSVLLMGSVLGTFPASPHFATHAYAAAKSAVVGFARACAAHYAPVGIRFNVIAPALVDTPMAARAANDPALQQFIRTKQPLDGGRIGRPGDLDGAVVWLLGDGGRFVTGQQIVVDGGWSVSNGQLHGATP